MNESIMKTEQKKRRRRNRKKDQKRAAMMVKRLDGKRKEWRLWDSD